MKLNFVFFLFLVFCSSAYTDNKENNEKESQLIIDYVEYEEPEKTGNQTGTTSSSM